MSRVQKVAEGVYRISLAWSNAYLLTEGGEATLIDAGLRKDRAALEAALAEIGIAKERVTTVCLTHGHCDHAGSAAFFSRNAPEYGGRARVLAHRDEARYLNTPRRTYVPAGLRGLRRPDSALLFAGGERLYPVERCGVDEPLVDGQSIAVPGGPLRVIACPGHTRGHVAYCRERDGLLFSGDAILNIIPIRRIPALSLPMRVFSEDWAQAIASARLLAELRPAALLPGHGPPILEDAAARLVEWAKKLPTTQKQTASHETMK